MIAIQMQLNAREDILFGQRGVSQEDKKIIQ